jgi:hypothetical protein
MEDPRILAACRTSDRGAPRWQGGARGAQPLFTTLPDRPHSPAPDQISEGVSHLLPFWIHGFFEARLLSFSPPVREPPHQDHRGIADPGQDVEPAIVEPQAQIPCGHDDRGRGHDEPGHVDDRLLQART